MKIINWTKTKIYERKSYKSRLNVLKWSLKFAEFYSSERVLDLRTMPTRVPLALLILTIHRYLNQGAGKLDKMNLFTEDGTIRKNANEPVEIEDDERF